MESLVSIIITAKNEEDVISRLIISVINQSYPKIETIVVDNNSSDFTKNIARKLGTKVYDFGPERSAQRNFGAKKSKGSYLLFLDADMELTKDVIKECVKLIKSNKYVSAIAIPEHSIATSFWGKVKAFERSIYNKRGDPLTDSARFYKRKVFFRVGGYDEDITGPEDWDLSECVEKAGYTIGRIKPHLIHHESSYSLLALARKKYYYALSSHKYFKKHNISVMSPKTIYFLRPIFYQNWRKLFRNPILSFGLCILLIVELISGGVGYIMGRLTSNEK